MIRFGSAKLAFISLMLAVIAVPVLNPAAAQQYGSVTGKYNPGHYVALTAVNNYSDMLAARQPGVQGFNRRYFWKDLEPEQDVYDFSLIRRDLERAHGMGLQLVVFVADKSFNGEKPTPEYAQGSDWVAANRAGGYTALRWKPAVLQRFKILLQKIGEEFDAHPAFEGVAIPESALSLESAILDEHNYTAVKYRKALVDTLLTAAAAMPNSRVFWYMNFIARDMSQINIIVNNVYEAGVIMGGPDLLPDDQKLQALVYPFYDKHEGKLPLFTSAQFDSYSHEHADTSNKTKYWTMWQLFRYARDDLHVNYIFWNNMTWREPDNAYMIDNAYAVMAKNQNFNETWSGDWLDTDDDGLSDFTEITLGTNPGKKDTDGDGLIDGKEVNTFLTNPLDRDTDGGGKYDKAEITAGSDPLDPADDGGSLADTDNDGLANHVEENLGTDPDNWDTDGEGLSDGAEVNTFNTNPLDKNTDKDQINDRNEILYKKTDPLNPDTDGDGLTDGQEASASGYGTDPLNPDTDGGGVPDGLEIDRGTDPLKRWDD